MNDHVKGDNNGDSFHFKAINDFNPTKVDHFKQS